MSHVQLTGPLVGARCGFCGKDLLAGGRNCRVAAIPCGSCSTVAASGRRTCAACGESQCGHSDPEFQGVVPPRDRRGRVPA